MSLAPLERNPAGVITTTPAADFSEVQGTIQLALHGDGVYNQEIAREHTITYKTTNDREISEERAKSYRDASFTVAVNHKNDETVDIVVTAIRHRLGRIFL